MSDHENPGVSMKITIIRKSDGVRVTANPPAWRAPPEWNESDVWFWTEGNFGCDCNRYLEFERALGNKPDVFDDEDDWRRCGHERYDVEFEDATKAKAG